MGANAANANGYDGAGQIVAVADTGIGGGTAATAHADIPASRIVAVNDWPAPNGALCWTAVNDGAIDVDSGHGTHVATSVLGGGGPGGEGAGTAPGASLIFQAVEDWSITFGSCAGSPDDYYLIGIPTTSDSSSSRPTTAAPGCTPTRGAATSSATTRSMPPTPTNSSGTTRT